MLAKYGRTHADSLIEVSNSFARCTLGVSVKEACVQRLKLELDPSHPKRMRHDFNAEWRGGVRSHGFVICLGASSQRDGWIIRPYSARTTGHNHRCVVFIGVSRSAAA